MELVGLSLGDDEGTEARTVRQIVTFIREQCYGKSNQAKGDIERVAYSIEAGDWKSK